MLPNVYRTWATIRLKDLKPWIAAWTLPEMYAGIEGQGAADAAYSTALQIEHCMVNGLDFTGGASDVYKCFDQVQRPIIYAMLKKAGMPRRILKTYEKFQEGLTAYNTIAGGIGEGYKKPTSVPQGDPLSMMVTALQMRPWIMQMKSMAVKPRILADDLQIFATGPRHLEWFTHAFDKTHLHLQDMGARIAPQKSLTFSSNNTARQWLRNHKWRILQDVVPVVNTCRDLGAHLNSLVNKKDGKTLTDRMHKAAGCAEMMGYIKTTYQNKRTVIKGKILPMGLYGCEVAPINEAVLTNGTCDEARL